MISKQLRQEIRDLYAHRCGYCGITEVEHGAELTIDHFQPLTAGGGDDKSNLVYACGPCNRFKGSIWKPLDEERILHPM